MVPAMYLGTKSMQCWNRIHRAADYEILDSIAPRCWTQVFVDARLVSTRRK